MEIGRYPQCLGLHHAIEPQQEWYVTASRKRAAWSDIVGPCTMAAENAEPKLTGYTALKTLTRTAGLLTGRRKDDHHGQEQRKMTRVGGGNISVDLVNGKLLQTIHGISLIQVGCV